MTQPGWRKIEDVPDVDWERGWLYQSNWSNVGNTERLTFDPHTARAKGAESALMGWSVSRHLFR